MEVVAEAGGAVVAAAVVAAAGPLPRGTGAAGSSGASTHSVLTSIAARTSRAVGRLSSQAASDSPPSLALLAEVSSSVQSYAYRHKQHVAHTCKSARERSR